MNSRAWHAFFRVLKAQTYSNRPLLSDFFFQMKKSKAGQLCFSLIIIFLLGFLFFRTDDSDTIFQFQALDINGKQVDLSRYRGTQSFLTIEITMMLIFFHLFCSFS